MADINRVRDPLELAAASPDPVVRQLALRYKELQAEMAPMKAFLDMYDSVKVGVATPQPQDGKPASSATGDAVVERVKVILVREGPLDLDALYEQYIKATPEDADRSREAFRVTLAKRRGDISRVSETDRRYWPAGVPLNGIHAAVA